tara:strand:- start:57 stop:452 length:396 start_codon:yes stop_codon:yes gene_type:complete
MGKHDIILDNSSDWLLEQLYNAKKADYETYRIYKCLHRYFNDKRDFIGVAEEIIPGTLRFKPLNDLADDCFFSVTFFSSYIRSRSKRRGSPGVKFYSSTGKHAYTQIGYPAIAQNWQFWVSYINKHINFNK